MKRYAAVVYGPTGREYHYGYHDSIAEAERALVGNTWGLCAPRIWDTQDYERGDVRMEEE
jgi:hypothetical protein